MITPVVFKENCRIKVLTRALGWIFLVLHEICIDNDEFLPPELVITSVNDSTHKMGSKHYSNEAIDIRSKNFGNRSDKMTFMALLKAHLDSNMFDRGKFTVLFESEGTENEHFHVQVKRGETFIGL